MVVGPARHYMHVSDKPAETLMKPPNYEIPDENKGLPKQISNVQGSSNSSEPDV